MTLLKESSLKGQLPLDISPEQDIRPLGPSNPNVPRPGLSQTAIPMCDSITCEMPTASIPSDDLLFQFPVAAITGDDWQMGSLVSPL